MTYDLYDLVYPIYLQSQKWETGLLVCSGTKKKTNISYYKNVT